MKISNLNNMIRGWVAGNFDPSVVKTDKFEVAVKHYKQGESEASHYHKLTLEVTIVVRGHVKMNNIVYSENDIIVIDPNESTDFVAMTDCTTVVIRDGSSIGDKYLS